MIALSQVQDVVARLRPMDMVCQILQHPQRQIFGSTLRAKYVSKAIKVDKNHQKLSKICAV